LIPLYAACVNFMIDTANMLGLTYRDINALILLVLFPGITMSCIVMCFFPYGKR
jgi:hypothetical protein